MAEIDTYPKCLIRNRQNWGDKVAIRRKRSGIWQSYTWDDFYVQSKFSGLGLVGLGLEPGDKVALIGDDKPEALWAECGIQAVGGIMVAMWSDAIASEVAYMLNHSDARFVFAEDQEQVDKILQIKDQIPKVEKVIYWNPKGLRQYDDPILISFEDLKKIGKEYEEVNPGSFEELISKSSRNDIAIICYTSGTTGNLPKGAIITHGAILQSAETMHEFIDLNLGDDAFCTFTAASIFHHWFLGFSFLRGAIINMPEGPETIMQDYREIAPKFILISPRQWQSLVSSTQVKVNDGGFFKRSTYDLFLDIGYKIVEFTSAGKTIPLHWKLLHKLGDVFVYKPLRDKVGLIKAKYPATGSAFLSPDFFQYYQAIGINLIQCYGSTEAGFVSSHPQNDMNIHSLGRVGSNVKVKLSDNQEILVGGEGIFSGYYKDEDKTNEELKDGWFYTGDAGYMDDNGHLYYHDRLQNLEEFDNVHIFAPAHIEGKLQFSKFIIDSMVLGGESRGYSSAIVAMDFETIGKWAEENSIPYTTFADLSQKDDLGDLLKKEIAGINKTLPQESRLKRFALLHKEFDPDDAELTRSRKMRKAFLLERYKELIDAIYAEKKEIPVVAEVKYRDGRKGELKTNIKIRTVE